MAGLSNTNEYINSPTIVERKAQSNYIKVIKNVNDIVELGKNENILTNIDDMNNKRKQLIENGSIHEGDITYTLINKTIDEVNGIFAKPNKSIEDIVGLYTTYNNFNDIYDRIGG